jgi:uncharacterized coiled-coil protein SlyX
MFCFETLTIPCFLSQMANNWTTTYCTHEEGFPKVLYAAIVRLGIPDHSEYVGHEYVEEGTEYCEVTVHIGSSDKFLEMKPWCVTATGSRLTDTYQLIARKALKYLSQMYEWHMGPTSMKYFPPLDRNRPAWEARIRTLESLTSQEDDPTIVAMSGYLLALDDMCERQYVQVRRITARTEVVEARWSKARVELAKVEARTAHAESCVIALEEELLEQADRHSKLLRGVYLMERAKRKECHPESVDPPILEGIPLSPVASRPKRMCESVPPTPLTSPHDEGTRGKEVLDDRAKPEEEDP